MCKASVNLRKYQSKGNIVFILLLFFIAIMYNYHNIVWERPYSIHQWRQADCLSLCANYFHEGRSFLEPAIHWLGDKDGKTVSECPILYYTVAKLWKIFGFHESVFRLLNVFIVFTGLFCLYRLVFQFVDDFIWSILIVFLLFSSPLLAFYSNNFLADAPAFGLVLIGAYMFWLGFIKQKTFFYILAFCFFLMAGLIKVSSLLLVIAIFILHFFAILFYSTNKWWFYKWFSLLPYSILFLSVYAWYSFANQYNQQNLSGIFLTGIFPIWELDNQSINDIWNSFFNELLPAFYNKKALLVIIVLFAISFVFYKKIDRLLLALSALVFIGVVGYLILFFKAFTVHDYYLTNLLIFIPLPLISVVVMLKNNHQALFKSNKLKIAIILLTTALIYETAVINRIKYSSDDWMVKSNFVLGTSTIEYWQWYHSDYKIKYKTYETITPYLRSLGLNRDDRFFCPSDQSINICLYLMDQKGYSAFGHTDKPLFQKMDYYKQRNVKYVIADSTFINNEDSLKPFLGSKIGQYKNLDIYSLH
jgi:hypothetical protein